MRIPEEIFTAARDMALRSGGVAPALFVHGTKGKVYMPLPFGETNAERVDIMTQAGVKLARSKGIGDVQTVYFVTEAWVSPAR